MFEQILILISVTTVLVGAPGPAPLALASSAVTYGMQGSLPLFAGQLVGLFLVMIGTSLGLARVFLSYPELKAVCQLIGAAYFIFFAYQISTAPIQSERRTVETSGFAFGVIIIALNPRVYVAIFAIFSQFLLPFNDSQVAIFMTAITCWLVALVVNMLWLALGRSLKPLFVNKSQIRMIRFILSVLMVSSAIFPLI